jgi:hypothetical protein
MVNTGRRAKVWTESEDRSLKDIKESCESESWSEVSSLLEQSIGVKRSAKQCRDRYFNYLTNQNVDSTWQDSEIDQLFECFLKHGTKWSLISKEIQSKNESQIKNLFYATIRRNIRKFNKGKLENEKITLKSLSILENTEIREILTAKKKIPKHFFSNRYLSNGALALIHTQSQNLTQEKKELNTVKAAAVQDDLTETDETWEEDQNIAESLLCSYFQKLDEIEPVLFY